MYKNKKILAIIPARGGSKGLPRKNILQLAGKPLIAWTIENAKQSKYIDKIIVSTDDSEIMEISKKYGAEVPFKRPDDLATDKAPSSGVILHAIDFLEKQNDYYDYICLLEPTSPLRKESDLDSAIKKLIDTNNADSLVSLGEVHLEHPDIIKKIEGDFIKPYLEVKTQITQRQQLNKAYFPYGVAYICKIDVYKETKTFYNTNTAYYEIERWQNYEIDDKWDFYCIEAILKEKIKERK
ncbi:acylneuraminate cytidylyltransferase family protein [Candidatus Desantisbacteria bacterium]|nr:acylneuraminate cytidylyltransferase family protein [Candidatus Desantisbacteria bacterium]